MRYLGTWTLPSGNACSAYFAADGQLTLEWETLPGPTWPAEDLLHYRFTTFPEICRALARETGKRILGVSA
jgi:hypothetical protein